MHADVCFHCIKHASVHPLHAARGSLFTSRVYLEENRKGVFIVKQFTQMCLSGVYTYMQLESWARVGK